MKPIHKTLLATVSLILLTAAGICGSFFRHKGNFPVASQKQQSEYAQQAELDSQGNIFVSSDQGKLIWMGNADQHCLELLGAADRQTMGCSVKQDLAQGNSPESSMSSLQLEIYRRDGHKQIIQPGAPILEWHFWKNGDQVAVYSGLRSEG